MDKKQTNKNKNVFLLRDHVIMFLECPEDSTEPVHYSCCGLNVNIVQHECMKVSYDAAAAVAIVTASDLPLPCSVQVTWSEPSLKKTHTHGFSEASQLTTTPVLLLCMHSKE